MLRVRDDQARVRALLTLGSALRQTGRHGEARAFDRRAFALASDDADRAHAHIGLAADHVGLGDVAGCARHLAEAAAFAPRGDWRAWVRLRWVRAEHALLRGDATTAVRESRAALERARAEGARRHEAKSLLFLGVALGAAGREGTTELRAAARIATRLGARPIADVAQAQLASSKLPATRT